MKLKDNLAKILIPILSILIAFIAGGIIILCLGKNPVEAYGYLFSGAFGSGRKMGQTLVIACPLIFTGLAAAFAYKCGVFNLGGEGQFIMSAVTSIFVSAKLGDAGMGGLLVSLLAGTVAGGIWGAIPGILKITRGLVGFLVGYETGSPWAGVLAGALSGIATNMIYAFCTITLCAEQTVYGMAINIFAPALASFIYRLSFSDTSTLIQGVSMGIMPIPVLSKIPVIFFQQSPLVYGAYLLVAVTAVFLNRTKAGLNFKAVGEFPKAAETLGINVVLQKYIACIICGALAGIGGAYLTICYTSTYSEGIVAGRGFIALSAVIFGRWMPTGVMFACLLFGFCDALQIRLQLLSPSTPYQILQMIPYLCTLFVLAFFGIKKSGPKANGQPYYREER